MRRWIISIILSLAIAAPAIALAQQGPYNDKQNPYEYTDTEDGQVLKLASYILAPIGYALEWGVARPLHYLATRTPLAPAMSGDTEYSEMYNPGPTVAPITPGPPPATVSSKGTAPHTYIERTPVGPSAVPAPLAPLTSPPAQPAMH
jgi:hypothetical protein